MIRESSHVVDQPLLAPSVLATSSHGKSYDASAREGEKIGPQSNDRSGKNDLSCLGANLGEALRNFGLFPHPLMLHSSPGRAWRTRCHPTNTSRTEFNVSTLGGTMGFPETSAKRGKIGKIAPLRTEHFQQLPCQTPGFGGSDAQKSPISGAGRGAGYGEPVCISGVGRPV